MAVYAARDLVPGEELFAHYGDDIGRDYAVGDPAPELFKYEVPTDELPYNWLLPGAKALSAGTPSAANSFCVILVESSNIRWTTPHVQQKKKIQSTRLCVCDRESVQHTEKKMTLA